MRYLIVATCMISGPALAADQFDLKCEGMKTVHPGVGTADEVRPFAIIYHVDLIRKKFCEDECRTIRDVAEVQPQFVMLYDTNREKP